MSLPNIESTQSIGTHKYTRPNNLSQKIIFYTTWTPCIIWTNSSLFVRTHLCMNVLQCCKMWHNNSSYHILLQSMKFSIFHREIFSFFLFLFFFFLFLFLQYFAEVNINGWPFLLTVISLLINAKNFRVK